MAIDMIDGVTNFEVFDDFPFLAEVAAILRDTLFV